MQYSTEDVNKILTKYAESISRHRPVIFCVKCGSTRLDQNSITELQCYDCGNIQSWNAFRFAVAREGKISDVESAIESAATYSFDDWHIELERVAQEFANEVVNDCMLPEGGTRQSLETLWAVCKENIDRLIEARRNGS
jgi:hypothetical protein